MTTTAVIGNPRPASRTRLAAEHVVQQLTGAPPDTVVDLVDLGPALLDWQDAGVAQAADVVRGSELVVFASPTYKATYTGLLKLFLERFSAGELSSVTAVALMLGGDWRHSLAPEAFLKPVLAEIGASTPTRGLFLLDSDWQTGEALTTWLDAARHQLPPRVLGAGSP